MVKYTVIFQKDFSILVFLHSWDTLVIVCILIYVLLDSLWAFYASIFFSWPIIFIFLNGLVWFWYLGYTGS